MRDVSVTDQPAQYTHGETVIRGQEGDGFFYRCFLVYASVVKDVMRGVSVTDRMVVHAGDLELCKC